MEVAACWWWRHGRIGERERFSRLLYGLHWLQSGLVSELAVREYWVKHCLRKRFDVDFNDTLRIRLSIYYCWFPLSSLSDAGWLCNRLDLESVIWSSRLFNECFWSRYYESSYTRHEIRTLLILSLSFHSIIQDFYASLRNIFLLF